MAATFVLGALVLSPFYLAETLGASAAARGHLGAAVGYVAVFPSVPAYLSYNRVVALVGPNTAGLVAHLVPVFGTVLAVLLLGETPRPYHALGTALIATGVWLSARGARPAR